MSDAKVWALEINRDWAAQMESLTDAVQYIGFEAINKIDKRTPVDTGRLRGNWNMSVGAPDTTVRETTDKSGGATVARNSAVVESYPEQGFPPMFLQNNLPYAEVREHKPSSQHPGGMVAITTAELAAIWEGIEI